MFPRVQSTIFHSQQMAHFGYCWWRCSDGKYILTGGEDDLVQVWSMEDQKIVAWGEGHNSWSSPSSDETGENVVYRFGSVGQDTQLLLWDLAVDEIAMPLRCPPGGSPTLSAGSPLAHWDNLSPVGTLQPAPSMRDVAKLSPVVAHRVHAEPLSGLIFTNESVLAICREGHIEVWVRPGHGSDNSQSSSSETALGTTTSKDRSIFPSVEGGGLSYQQPPPILLRD